jgi:broad specificity phosphatase PhoE
VEPEITLVEAPLEPVRTHRSAMRRSWPLLSILASTALLAGFMAWPRAPLDLGQDNNVVEAELQAHWRAGHVIALVRHSERCDRAPGPCRAQADGITVAGNRVAGRLNSAFSSLGMQNLDVLSSPLTRTAQTADAMFERDVQAHAWLRSCGPTLAEQLQQHKAAGRNLVAVTHSGCISEFKELLGYAGGADEEYTSTVFAQQDEQGKLHLLGFVNAQDWEQVIARNAAL